MANIAQKSGQVFEVWINEIQTAYDVFEQDVTNTIIRMRQLGMSDSQIFERLSYSLNNGLNEFQSFRGWLGSSSDNMINTISQIVSNETIKTQAEQWRWELDPTARDHCPDCMRNANQVMSFDEWEEIGLPGYGNTVCGIYCRCTLVPE